MTPQEAREYVKNFKHILGKEATYVQTSNGREIHFETMDDEDAIWVADQLRKLEFEASKRYKGHHQ